MKNETEVKSTVKECLEIFIKELNRIYPTYIWKAKINKKYAKISHVGENNPMSESVCSFIDLEYGIVYKSAGYKARSNTVWGSIFEPLVMARKFEKRTFCGLSHQIIRD